MNHSSKMCFECPDARAGHRLNRVVEPVFLPFKGCPHRCLYCSQHAQTGVADRPLEREYAALERRLEEKSRQNGPLFEVGFFGGTFTSLPGEWPERFTALAGKYAKAGRVSAIRCSTRPDALGGGILPRLRDLGLTMVELGVQSFDADVLHSLGRGYGPETALGGCRAVKEAGLDLGVQLMPGAPGDRPGVFMEDVRLAVSSGADATRLYPCLVLEDTGLARLWRDGLYLPWPLDRTVAELGRAVLALWQAGVRVMRIGLARQEGMRVLDGPEHPALGQSVKGRAVYEWLAGILGERGYGPERPVERLLVPRRVQGHFLGHAGELAPAYAALGLSPRAVDYHTENHFALR